LIAVTRQETGAIGSDIWVMDNRVRYIDEAPGLQDIDLMRVRGVPGVAWAVRT